MVLYTAHNQRLTASQWPCMTMRSQRLKRTQHALAINGHRRIDWRRISCAFSLCLSQFLFSFKFILSWHYIKILVIQDNKFKKKIKETVRG